MDLFTLSIMSSGPHISCHIDRPGRAHTPVSLLPSAFRSSYTLPLVEPHAVLRSSDAFLRYRTKDTPVAEPPEVPSRV